MPALSDTRSFWLRRGHAWVLVAAVACAPSPKPAAKTPATQAAAGAESAVPSTPTPSLAVREDLPVEAREVLAGRMMRHGDQIGAMTLAVVLLDYEVVRLLTARMSDEPMLGRPSAGDKHSLNALLPASFFVHQDQLHEATRALAAAAAQTDDLKLVAAFNEVNKTCVGCHSAYLHEALVEEPEILPPCEVPGRCDQEYEPEGSAREPDYER